MNKLIQEDFSIKLKASIYNKVVITRACYSLSDKALFELQEEGCEYLVGIKLINNASAEQVKEQLAAALIDFSLRYEIEEKTKVVRDTIVIAALAESI